jgi:hypothetical protein
MPEIADDTRKDKTDETEWDIIAGHALRVAVKKDYCEEPYAYKPFLVLHNDRNNINYAVPTDKPIEIFAL